MDIFKGPAIFLTLPNSLILSNKQTSWHLLFSDIESDRLGEKEDIKKIYMEAEDQRKNKS